MTLVLTRFASGPGGTFGALVDGEVPIVLTLELPWLDNRRSVSCIPAQCYHAVRTKRPKHGECFELRNVPGRSDILIHNANTIRDLKGCIGVAMYFGKLEKYPELPALLNNPIGPKAGLRRLMGYLQNTKEFDLEIKNAFY